MKQDLSEIVNVNVTSGFKTVPEQRHFMNQHGQIWMEAYRRQCNVGPYWRIHNKLYDLKPFMDRHPGGKYWLKVTQGTDVTEVFESFHLTEKPQEMLQKFYVKDINTPRLSPYTFKENGFYKTLKKRIAPIVKNMQNGPTLEMKITQDTMFVMFLAYMIYASMLKSYFHMIGAGIVLWAASSCAHNFFHQKDNWRMYIWDCGLFASQEWRLTHALSHHMFPNTIYDYEITSYEPFVTLLPYKNKNKLWGFLQATSANITYYAGFHVDFFRRMFFCLIGRTEFEPSIIIQPILYLIISYFSQSFWMGFKLWMVLQSTFTYFFQWMAAIVGHQSKNSFIESDKYIEDKDWGLLQIAATFSLEKQEPPLNTMYGLFNRLRIRTCLGYHTLHHLFPTIDQSKLPLLRDAVEEHYKEFGITPIKQNDTFSGYYWRCANTEPNDVYYDKFLNFERSK